MAARGDQYGSIDQNIAANLRTYREAGGTSQEDLAQRMADRGFGFSQATIWKIEGGQRPVKASELVALAHCLQILSPISLTYEPDTARHRAELREANHQALEAYETLKAAAAAYIEAQVVALVAARSAHDDGVTLTELDTSWLGIPAEQAVIEARVEGDQQDAQSEHIHDEVSKIMAALRTTDYQATWRIEDVQVEPGGPLGVWTPGASGTQTEAPGSQN
jgi:transcriptional regulator with XRE-family HTH domain